MVICHGITGSCHEGVVDLIASWLGRSCRLDTKLLWSMIPHFLMWVIWRERNTCTFEGDERWIHELKLFFLQTSLEWVNALGFITFMSLPDMLIFVPSLLFRFFLCCLFFNFNEVHYLSKKFIMVLKQEVWDSNLVSTLNPIYRIPMHLAPCNKANLGHTEGGVLD